MLKLKIAANGYLKVCFRENHGDTEKIERICMKSMPSSEMCFCFPVSLYELG